jgi:single-strand DNA-binding protein
MGRITKDVELRRTGTGVAVASFTVACDRDFGQNGQKETDFFDCVAWRGTGEFIERNFSKGKMIVVSGRLQNRKWEDKNGNKRVSAEIVAENAYFADSKKDVGEKYEAAMKHGDPLQDFAVLDGDDSSLPF